MQWEVCLLVFIDSDFYAMGFFFSTCCPNWTQVCSHLIGYIPVPIVLLFAIAPTLDLSGNGATQTCTWALKNSNHVSSLNVATRVILCNGLLLLV